MAKLSCFAIILVSCSFLNFPVQAASPTVTVAIDQFVETIAPEDSHYFWIVNDTKSDNHREVIVDLNAVLMDRDWEKPTQTRFLLLIVDGKLFAAQNIPLNATVDCGDEKV